jgi:predicted MFS family arabinose efflux permease
MNFCSLESTKSAPRNASIALLVLFAVNLFNIYDRTILSPALEPIRNEFHLTDTQLGALSTVFILVYAVAGLPIGRWCDRGDRRMLLAAGIAVWTLCTSAGALASGYVPLLVSRLGVGVGEAVCAPAATSWIGDVVPASRRARALAIFMLGVPLGMLLSYSVNGPLAQAYGWRTALALAGLPGLLLVPAVLMLRSPVRTAPAAAESIGGWSLFRLPAFGWIVASGALLNFNLYALSAFLPTFLTRYHRWSLAEAGLWSGLGLGLAGLVGGLTMAAKGDRWTGGARLRASAILTIAAVPLTTAGILLPREAGASAWAAVLIVVGYGLLNTYYALTYAAIQDLVAPHLRATAMSIYFLAMYVCGGAFGPMLTGRLSDALAHRALLSGLPTEAARAAGLHEAMLIIPALSIALALVLWKAARAMRHARTF